MSYPIRFKSKDSVEMSFQPDAVILANGEYPEHGLPLGILAKAPYVACCDGAANTFIDRGGAPDVIIGDGDSLHEAYRDKLYRVGEQESNDLTKAVLFLKGLGKRRLIILGATGKREDHTLGNISLLMEFQKMGLQVCMLTDFGLFVPCHGQQTFDCYLGQQISIFNFGAKGLKAEGLVYPIRDFTTWWQGTLNEADRTEVRFQAEGDYLVYLNY